MTHLDCTTSAQVQDALNKHGGVAVVDCHATWCGPCKQIAPYVQKKNQ
jgi:thiol-disulfide isomerase/thioredoxin